ncbi:MAG: tetratricopeptide repeat protein [Rubripirellula sp.]
MIEAYQRALAAFQVGRYDLCEQCVRDGLIESPNDVDLMVLLAHCKLATDQYAAVRSMSQDVIRLDPDDARGYSLLAWGTISDGHYEPVDPRTGRRSSGFLVASQRRLDIGGELAKRCLELEPSGARHFALLAEVERLRDALPEALLAAERGLAIDPDHGACARTRIRVLTELRRPDDAVEAALHRLSVDPEDTACHHMLAELYLGQFDTVQALPHARQAVRLEPTDREHRRIYWDCVKADHALFRPFVLWQFFARRISAIALPLRVCAFASSVIVAARFAVYFSQREGMAYAPVLVILAFGLVIALLSSERPCMVFVDLAMFAVDPDYRASVDRRTLFRDAGLCVLGVLGLVAIGLTAFEIFWPILILVAALIASPTVYYLCRADSLILRIGFGVSLIVMACLAYSTVELFAGSSPGSKPRLFSMYAFMAFLFLGVAAPALYGQRVTSQRSNAAF